MKSKLRFVLALALLGGRVGAAAQGTAFLYQGLLSSNGVPANTPYDMSFALYTAATNGVDLSGVFNYGIAVSNGLFTTQVDFGTNVFAGPTYWLGVGVRNSADAGNFTLLTPRQPIAPGGSGTMNGGGYSLTGGFQLVLNGGFETADFSDWSQSGNVADTVVSTGSPYVHSGQFGAKLGPPNSLGYLSQTLRTSPGESYQVSLWLDSPDGQGPNEFLIQWGGSTIFDQVNIPAIGWTNLQFVAVAGGTNTVLQFGFRDDPSYLGLDDIIVIPLRAPQNLGSYNIPERFGVIDITPTNLSGEASQNSEPSLGVGLNAKYGDSIVHAFTGNYYYTSKSAMGPEWSSPGTVSDRDASLDWSAGGTCYIALIPKLTQISVLTSPDPTATGFSALANASITKGTANNYPDQPWVRVVTVTNADHIFVGYNDLSVFPGKTATVRYSMDSGTTWNESVIEKVATTVGWDSPAVRLAISADGKTVYALFQRATNWVGASFGSDFNGEVVLTRDDSYGGGGFGALGIGGEGTKVAAGIVLPWNRGTSLGAQRLGSGCDVAINPTQPATVYVAYTQVSNGKPGINLARSADSGATFSDIYDIANASLPSLALTTDNLLGMLYALKNGTDLEVHFLKANLATGILKDRILAKFPNNTPTRAWDPYIGDYFVLRAVGYNFFGAFCASGDPQPSHFPSGVFFQRNVKVNGVIYNNLWLAAPGSLVDNSGQNVSPSIDPFVFYDFAPLTSFHAYPAYYIPPDMNNPGDPLTGIPHLSWPVLPASEPPLQLYASSNLGAGANWRQATNNSILQTNGQNLATFVETQGQQFFRLQQNVASGQFRLFASAGANGSLSPNGILTNAGLTSQTFTVAASNNYALSAWYLDGVAVPPSGSSFTLSNIATEHTLVATFVASDDLAVTVAEFSAGEGPTETDTTNRYVIDIENKGLNTLTGISLTNSLDPNVSFISASTTQGSVSNSSAGLVTANIGSLGPGALATVSIQFVTVLATNIVDTASVACGQFEPDLSNNTATDVTTVIEPVRITGQPAPQTVPVGGTAVFSVGVTGTPPLTYQWYLNGTNLLGGAPGSTLTITNVSAANAGTYSVSVLQILGPEDIEGDTSQPATLTVQ